jgi:hypothetical protein
MGLADCVTLARAVLACGVAALTMDTFGGQAPAAILVALAERAAADLGDSCVATQLHAVIVFWGARPRTRSLSPVAERH